MKESASSTIAVEIFGAVYHLRGNDDGEYLKELAGYVDRKMREVAGKASAVDVPRLAILTALNLSDELFQCRKGQEGERVRIKEKVTQLTDALTTALATEP
ncbi:MAG TPA: cell division protein ZapA [Thermoanaerobaculia bacterium]|nr:cell division protein ZapA [Thermoanaerobaculia bacterium]